MVLSLPEQWRELEKAGSSTATSTEPLPLEEELIEILDFGFGVENILLNQGDNHFDFKSERIKLFENEPFIISIPFATLPDNLKSIIVHPTRPD